MTQSFTDFYPFTLPLGYADAAGRLHRHGQMRLATAYDEIEPLGDRRVQDNEAFFGLLLLSRVIAQLGDFSPVPPEVIAGLYASDFAYLQAFYGELNSGQAAAQVFGVAGPDWLRGPVADAAGGQRAGVETRSVETTCPQCGTELILDLGGEP